MIKVKIYDLDEDSEFFSEMPYLPNKGDQIGYNIGDEWYSKEVVRLAHDFNDKNIFDYTEICVSDDESNK